MSELHRPSDPPFILSPYSPDCRTLRVIFRPIEVRCNEIRAMAHCAKRHVASHLKIPRTVVLTLQARRSCHLTPGKLGIEPTQPLPRYAPQLHLGLRSIANVPGGRMCQTAPSQAGEARCNSILTGSGPAILRSPKLTARTKRPAATRFRRRSTCSSSAAAPPV